MRRTELRDLIETATEALGRYRLRTSLSVVGVVLGVASVIAMMSVSEGAAREALAQVEALGLDNLVARSRPPGAAGAFRPLEAGDAARIAALVPGVDGAAALIDRHVRLHHDDRSTLGHAIGIEPGYQSATRLVPARGRLLTPFDERTSARTCVLGASLARRLFGYRDPVGASIGIGDSSATVVGVLAPNGTAARSGTSLAWRDIDEAALLPLSTLSGSSVMIASDQPVDEIWVKLLEGERAVELSEVLGHALSRLDGGRDADLVVPRELLAQRQRTQRTFSIVIGSVAVLALLVGGIGIMNIMLTSVVERTREIGVRRTAGATRRDVARQFLAEALLMTMAGGLAGILLGVLVSVAIAAFAEWQTHVSAVAVLLAFISSCAVGLVFGIYPAMQAARLEPVDAMRYE